MKSMQAKLGDIGRKVVHILQSMQCSRMPRGHPGSAAQHREPSAMARDSAEPGDRRHEKIRLWRRRLDVSAYCGTFFVEPLILLDGRVQGFSYISSAAV